MWYSIRALWYFCDILLIKLLSKYYMHCTYSDYNQMHVVRPDPREERISDCARILSRSSIWWYSAVCHDGNRWCRCFCGNIDEENIKSWSYLRGRRQHFLPAAAHYRVLFLEYCKSFPWERFVSVLYLFHIALLFMVTILLFYKTWYRWNKVVL